MDRIEHARSAAVSLPGVGSPGETQALLRLLLLAPRVRRAIDGAAALDRAIERAFPGAPPRASALDDATIARLARASSSIETDEVAPHDIGALYAELQGDARRARGAWFTPPVVARALAEHVLDGAPPDGPVADPAAGGGALLDAVASVLRDGGAPAREIALRLAGLDGDADATLLARHVLRARLGHDVHVHHADALATPALARSHPGGALAPPSPLEPGSVAALVANPPFVAAYARGAQRLLPARAELLAARFPSIGKGERNAFLHFLALALELVRAGGRLGVVVPDTLLVNERYERTRRALLDACGDVRALVLDWPVFGKATVRTAVLVATRGAGRPGLTIETYPGEDALAARRPGSSVTVARSALEERPCFAFPRGSTDLGLEAKVRARGIPLERLCWVRDGLNPGPRSFRERILVARADAGDLGGRPCLEGRDVHPWRVAEPRLLVRDDPALLTPELRRAGASFREPWIFDREKLVSRQTAARIAFAREPAGHRFLNSVHGTGLLDGTEESLLYVLAVLNSSALAWWHARTTGETRKVFPQVHVRALRTLPVPRAPAAHDALVALARRLEECPEDEPALLELDERAGELFDLGAADRKRIAREVAELGAPTAPPEPARRRAVRGARRAR